MSTTRQGAANRGPVVLPSLRAMLHWDARQCLHRTALLGLILLAGCGGGASNTIQPVPVERVPTFATPVARPTAGLPPAASASPPAPLAPASAGSALPAASAAPAPADPIAAVLGAYANLRDYTCYIRGYAQGSDSIQSLLVSYAFAKPGSTRLQVVAADDDDLTGAILVYTGGDQLVYRGKEGFVHEFPQSLSINDQRLLTGLGNNITQAGIGWMIQRLIQPGASIRSLTRAGQTAIAGRSVDWYEITATAAATGGGREVLAVDRELHLPISHEVYAPSGEQIYLATILGLRINTGLPADTFQP